MSREERKEKFLRWLDGGVDLTDAFPDEERFPDPPREELKREEKTAHRAIVGEKKVRAFMNREKRGFRTLYRVVAGDIANHLRVRFNHGQRRTQVVGDVCDELLLVILLVCNLRGHIV